VTARVVGLGQGPAAVAVPREEVARAGVVTVEVGGRDVVLWHLPGQASALDTARIRDGRDVGSVAAFVAALDGRPLTWRRDDDGFVDHQTGSRWDLDGTATAGPLTGARLAPALHLDTFWFAWVAFQPGTRLWE